MNIIKKNTLHLPISMQQQKNKMRHTLTYCNYTYYLIEKMRQKTLNNISNEGYKLFYAKSFSEIQPKNFHYFSCSFLFQKIIMGHVKETYKT